MLSIKAFLFLTPIFAAPVLPAFCSVDVPCLEGFNCVDSAIGPFCEAVPAKVDLVGEGEACSVEISCAEGLQCVDSQSGPYCKAVQIGLRGDGESCSATAACVEGYKCLDTPEGPLCSVKL